MWKDEKVFDSFDGDARVWIYQSSRQINSREIERIESEVNKFCKQWKAHGSKLAAAGAVLYDRFIVLVVDEKAEAASGCSIDTSVHMIQDLGKLLQIDFFDRLQVIYVNDKKQLADFHSSDATGLIGKGKINNETLVFNNMVLNIQELRTNWKKPLKETWLRRYI